MTTTIPSYSSDGYLGANPGLERLYDNVQIVAPTAALPVVKMELWNAIEDFSIRSRLFHAGVTWSMPAGVTSVDFNPYDENMVVTWINDVTGLGQFHVEGDSVLVDENGAAAAARTGTATLILKPASFDVNLPSILFSTWFETMRHGLLSRLYAQPAKPYSNAALAQVHYLGFERGLRMASATAAIDRARRLGRGWVFPRMGTRRK
jgi:hypothetical protein